MQICQCFCAHTLTATRPCPTRVPVLAQPLLHLWGQSTCTHPYHRKANSSCLPSFGRYFDWWAATRDVDGNGLVAIIHGWESGIDASPAYDAAYGITDPHPSSRNIYPRFIKLLLSYKLMYEWNVDTILARRSAPWSLLDNWFVVFDVGLNSVYAAGWGVLAELADRFNTSLAAHCRSRQAVVEQVSTWTITACLAACCANAFAAVVT